MQELDYHNDITQGSEAWHQIRAGRFGASRAALWLVNGKRPDKIGATALAYITEKAAYHISREVPDSYLSPAMERGLDLEPLARRAYEDHTFEIVDECGYVSAGEYIGISPDGLVGDDGGVEIKCLAAKNHLGLINGDPIPNKYRAQCQYSLWVTGRAYWDNVYYHPSFGAKSLLTYRIEPDAEYFDTFEAKLPAAIKELERLVSLCELETKAGKAAIAQVENERA